MATLKRSFCVKIAGAATIWATFGNLWTTFLCHTAQKSQFYDAL